jgi:predicted SAM-dependent methyltransferase
MHLKTYLNLGCGERYHPDWINIDVISRGPDVIKHDVSTGLPFPAESADAVYSAAVFEHIRRRNVRKFLTEIYRVVKPGGIIRVGVPDLEKICRLYLDRLEAAIAGDKQASNDYDWLVLEMLDQMSRETSGGEMINYLRQNPLPNEDFVYERIGNEGRHIVESLRREMATAKSLPQSSIYRRFRMVARQMRNRLLNMLAGPDAVKALTVGRFRLSGEAHQWMYDRYSLARELVAVGFGEPIVCEAIESAIADWPRFHLDIAPDGTINKPDLLFMEATKPA